MKELRTVYCDHMHFVGSFHDVFIGVSKHEPSLQFLKDVTQGMREVAKSYPDGVGLLIVLSSDAPPPSDESRKHLKRALPTLVPSLKGMARVVEGEGFLAASKRGAISLMDLVFRLPYPVGVFGRPVDAAVWLRRVMKRESSTVYTQADIVSAVEEARKIQAGGQVAARPRTPGLGPR